MPGTRELIVRGTSLIVAYRALSDTVHVLRILHTAKRWPTTTHQRRLGFMIGAITIPDDFDLMGTDEIEKLFGDGA